MLEDAQDCHNSYCMFSPVQNPLPKCTSGPMPMLNLIRLYIVFPCVSVLNGVAIFIKISYKPMNMWEKVSAERRH